METHLNSSAPEPGSETGGTSPRSLSPRSLASLGSMPLGLRVFFAAITQVATWAMQYMALRELAPELRESFAHLRATGQWLPLAIAAGLAGFTLAPLSALKALAIVKDIKLGKKTDQ